MKQGGLCVGVGGGIRIGVSFFFLNRKFNLIVGIGGGNGDLFLWLVLSVSMCAV